MVATSGSFTSASNGWQKMFSLNGVRYLTLYPTTSSTGVRWRGYALIESIELTGDVNDVIRGQFTWAGHGAVLYTTG